MYHQMPGSVNARQGDGEAIDCKTDPQGKEKNVNKAITSMSPESIKGRAGRVFKEVKAKVLVQIYSRDTKLQTLWALLLLLSFLCHI